MCKKSFDLSSADSWETLIVGLCIILLLLGAATFVIKQWWLTPEPQKIEVIIAPQDSIRSMYYYDKTSLDSLVAVINNHIAKNERKYVQMSATQEDNRFKSLASMLIGIISSIALFFGYKSFRDIREKGKEMSKEVAENAAKDIAKTSAEEFLNSQLPGIVKKELNEGLYNQEVINSTKDSIIAELKPILFSEFRREFGSQNETDGQQNSDGDAMSPEEMFNSSISTPNEPASQTSEAIFDESPSVEPQKKESNGKD